MIGLYQCSTFFATEFDLETVFGSLGILAFCLLCERFSGSIPPKDTISGKPY